MRFVTWFRSLRRRRKPDRYEKDRELREKLFEAQMIAQDKLGLKWVAAKGSEFVVKGWTPRELFSSGYDLPKFNEDEIIEAFDTMMREANSGESSGGTLSLPVGAGESNGGGGQPPKYLRTPQSPSLKLVKK